MELKNEVVRKFESALADKNNNLPYAVIQALNFVVNQSRETTTQAMYEELKQMSQHVLDFSRTNPLIGDRTLLAL